MTKNDFLDWERVIAAIEDVATGIPADGDVPPVFDAQEVIDE